MGRASLEGMLEFGDYEQVLRWHLRANHYPPIDLVFLDTAREAISLANQGEWEQIILMPNGISKPVHEIIEELHLSEFLLWEDGDV